jgi:hypothetical protein
LNKFHTLGALVVAITAACGAVKEDRPDVDAGLDGDAPGVDAPVVDAPVGIAVAPPDNDSQQNPAVSHFLSITGTRNFTYANEVSAPTGDTEDFVAFEFPNNSNPSQVVRVTLACTITGAADAVGTVEIFEDEVLGTLNVLCNAGQQTLTVNNTKVQTARIRFSRADEPSHLAYTLTVVGFQ